MMIDKTRFALLGDRMPHKDAIPWPFALPPFRSYTDEIETWEFGSTLKTEPKPQLIPRLYGIQHF